MNRPLEVRPESDDARRDAEAIRMSKPTHDKPAINKPDSEMDTASDLCVDGSAT